MSLCLCLCLCLCLSPLSLSSVSFSLSSLSVSPLSLSAHFSLFLSPLYPLSLPFSLCLPPHPLSLSTPLSVFVCLSVFLSLCVCLSLCVSLCLCLSVCMCVCVCALGFHFPGTLKVCVQISCWLRLCFLIGTDRGMQGLIHVFKYSRVGCCYCYKTLNLAHTTAVARDNCIIKLCFLCEHFSFYTTWTLFW